VKAKRRPVTGANLRGAPVIEVSTVRLEWGPVRTYLWCEGAGIVFAFFRDPPGGYPHPPTLYEANARELPKGNEAINALDGWRLIAEGPAASARFVELGGTAD
jgi:hypothetical protein